MKPEITVKIDVAIIFYSNRVKNGTKRINAWPEDTIPPNREDVQEVSRECTILRVRRLCL